jgi:NTE family protein
MADLTREPAGRQRRIAVSLPASYFGFYAHVGFVKALDEMGVVPSAVAGASAGGLVAAMWAGGLDGAAMEQILCRLRREDFWEPWRWISLARGLVTGFRGWTGFLTGKRFEAMLERTLPVRRFEECRFPLFLVSTDLTRGRRHVFRDGEIIPAVASSCAYPLLFESVRIGDNHYVDGGLVDKVPLDELVADHPDLILVHYLRPDPDGEPADPHRRSLTPLHLFRRGIDIIRERELEFKLRWVENQGVRLALLESRVPALGPRRLAAGPRALAAAHEQAMAALPGILGSLSR